MLEELLHYLERGGTFSLRELSVRFDVSEALLEQMLADLVRMGYLRAWQGCEQMQCTGCSHKATCASFQTDRVWSVVAGAKGGQK